MFTVNTGHEAVVIFGQTDTVQTPCMLPVQNAETGQTAESSGVVGLRSERGWRGTLQPGSQWCHDLRHKPAAHPATPATRLQAHLKWKNCRFRPTFRALRVKTLYASGCQSWPRWRSYSPWCHFSEAEISSWLLTPHVPVLHVIWSYEC